MENTHESPQQSSAADDHGFNDDILAGLIPDWLVDASPQRREALNKAQGALPQWFLSASKAQRLSLHEHYEASFASQNLLDKTMSSLQQINTFAEPLLVKALKDQLGVGLDVNKTFLLLKKPVELGVFKIEAGSFEVTKLPLLQAALHNFEEAESVRGAFHSSSGFVVEESTGDNRQVLTTLSVAGFIKLCRELDIGAKYQTYLNGFLKPSDIVAEGVLRERFIASQKSAMRAAAELALLKKDIEPKDYSMILSVIDGEINPKVDDKPVWIGDLVLMKKRMTGCVFFHICEKYRYSDEVILYIPHDPQHPLKRYKGHEMEADFKRRFMTEEVAKPDGGPTDYQRFFSQFVAYADRPYYFSQFTQKAPDSPPDAAAPLRSPVWQLVDAFNPFSAITRPRELPPAPPAKQEPVDDPFVRTSGFRRNGLWGPNVDLWLDLYEQSTDKILADARSHAVPTADVDARARAEKIARLQEIGMLALNVASMFVPGFGEVMMIVMATQITYEAFEGAVEWSEGDRKAALAHLTDVAENLALIAVMHGAGKGLAKVTAIKPEPVVDGLQPITLPSGQQKLWKPDLGPYKTTISLPADSQPNKLGLHRYNGQDILPLDDSHFVVDQDPVSGQHAIQHPSRSDAYAPQLEHNGVGSWISEIDQPLTWHGPKLMKRLGYRAQAFTDTQLEQVRISSGAEPDQLRRMHVEQEPPSALLTDSLTRFRIDRDIEVFKARISSDVPRVFGSADLHLQFKLMRSQGLLPDTPPLRVLDGKGKMIWEDPLDGGVSSRRLIFMVSDQESAKGTVLRSLLEMYKAQNVELDNVPGAADAPLDQRAVELRKEIASAAQDRKLTLFESLYREQNATGERDVQRIQGFFPKLPTVVAKQILEAATPQELAVIARPGPLPQGIYEQAQWCQQELRMAHAYEGLYLDQANIDSERLALHSLATLPGWPTETRFELRSYGPQGRLLDAVGTSQTTVVLVLDDNTRFAQTSSANLYSTLLQALSPDERQALGFTLQEAQKLKQAVQQSPMPREQFRTVLLNQRDLKASVEPGSRLRGGGYPLPSAKEMVNFFRTSRGRVRRLYPDFSEAQIEAFLQTPGVDVRDELTRLETEFATLKRDLNAWIEERTRAQTSSPVPHEPAGVEAQLIASRLRRSWCRQSGSTLSISSTMELPALTAQFDHVEELELLGVGLNAGASGFLKGFTRLTKLSMRWMELTQLPETIGEMGRLTHLNLSENHIQLNEQSAGLLAAMSTLETLDLEHNPLGISPDFSAMTRLKTVDLRHTGITQWPKGLQDQAGLETVDLRDNQLREVPSAVLNPPADQLEAVARVNRVTLLEGNPFSPQGRTQLLDYRERLTRTRPELLEGGITGAFHVQNPMLARVRQLYPDFSDAEIEAFLQPLGDGAEVELVRLEREFETLNEQLSAWAFSGGGARQTYVRAGGNIRLGTRAERYTAAERIRRCWKRQAPRRNAVDGTPIGFELDLSHETLDSVPDLEADFSHVGSLKLNNMGLSVSPEGFLSRFRGVRWLNMAENRLTTLPPALGEMNGLTRLFLEGNRIRLTPETAELLAGRTTLRALNLSRNPLGMTLDFTQIADMRSLFLDDVGLETWPVGLAAQPLLDNIVLRNNLITTIPESVINPPAEQLDRMAAINSRTYIGGNPLSEASQQQLRDYWTRLERERPDLGAVRYPGVFEFQAPEATGALERVRLGAQQQTALERWTKDLTVDQLSARQIQWQALFQQAESEGFFRVLNDLQEAGAGHEDLQRRVWEVIDPITQTSPESEALREQMFEWAGRPACCDRAALSFSNLEIMAMVYKARTLAMDAEQGEALLKLSRGLFRLDEVEKIALADIEKRTAAIKNSERSAAEKARLINKMEDVEIKLAYRFGLKDRLDLPGQPQQVRFVVITDDESTLLRNPYAVTRKMLDDAYARVVGLNSSDDELQALLSRDFWKDFVTNKYRPQFETQREPYQERHASLRDRHKAGTLSEPLFTSQSDDLDVQLQIEEAALIEKLTREELVKHPL